MRLEMGSMTNHTQS